MFSIQTLHKLSVKRFFILLNWLWVCGMRAHNSNTFFFLLYWKKKKEEEEIHLKRDLFRRSKNAIFFFRVLFPTIHSLILISEKEITIFPQ